jgi:hypothetical protein
VFDNMSTFLHLVSHIVRRSSEEHVRRIYAFWVVTRMTNKQSIRDRSARQSVRDSMGLVVFPSELDTSVPGATQGIGPLPTFIRGAFRNLGFEGALRRTPLVTVEVAGVDLDQGTASYAWA